MIFIVLIIGAYMLALFHYSFEIKEEAEILLDKVLQQCVYLNRVTGNRVDHIQYGLEGAKYNLQYMGILDDDEDVYGHQYRLYFHIPALSKAKVGLIDYMFYEDKPYKNRKEIILWQDNKESQELSYSDKLVKKLMTVTIQKLLKKKLPELAKSTSH